MSDGRSWMERTFGDCRNDMGCAFCVAICGVGGGIGAVLVAVAWAIMARNL